MATIIAVGDWWRLEDDGTLYIYCTGDMPFDYDDVFDIPWFDYLNTIQSIVIQNSVTNIGNDAFGGCENLTSVTIGSGVTSIGDRAFENCFGLTIVTIPDSVTSIGERAFTCCESLTSVTIPDSVTSIGQEAFVSCQSLASAIIPSSVTSIGSSAFAKCGSLTSVTIPDPGSANYDWYAVFQGSDSTVTSLTISDGVINIGDNAFSGSYFADGATITIPDSVTSIGDGAFWECYGLTSVALGNGVVSIGENAFRQCESLATITIPASVISIGDGAFDYIDTLTDIYYGGTQAQWNAITKGSGNDALENATIHYSGAPPTPSTTYTVTFDANGGTGNMSAQTFTAGTAQTFTPNTFTRSGYTFSGWNTAQNGSGTNYADGASYTATGNVTLYAQWTPVVLSSIAITTTPAKTAYTVGDTFDPSGMTVTATYSNGTTAPVTGYDYKETPLTLSDTSIGIGYFENGVYAETAVTITVTEPELEPTPTANRITIQVAKRNGNALTFSEHAVKQLEYVQSTSFDGNDVQADEFSAVIRQTAMDWLNNWNGVNRASPVILTLVPRTEKYYFKSIRRVAKYNFELTAQSPLGRLTDDFPGGLYSAASLRDVITAVIGNAIPVSAYSVNPLLSKVRVYGWIPYQARRTTLHQLALAYGFLIRRDMGNNLYFTVPDTDNADTIPDNAIFTGGSVDYSIGQTYARADITAYDYLPRETETRILFDNTDSAPADKLIVRFDSPMFDLRTKQGLKILGYGVNYARVSGSGQLTGKPYTKIESVISVEGDSNADKQHILSVSGVPLITSLNAVSVGERLLDYHNAPAVVNMDILRTTQRSGDYVSFTDPFGDTRTGYITALSGSITSIDRASASIVCGYVPSWGAAFDAVTVLTGSGSWPVPAALDGTTIRLVLIGGGTGGSSGQHGTDSNGKGGIGGPPGSGGMIYDTTLTVHEGETFTYNCGTGGAGGEPSDETSNQLDGSMRVYVSGGKYHLKAHGEGTFYETTLADAQDNLQLTACPDCFQASDRYYVSNAGSPGTASTFGDYSSGNGSRSNAGFYDIIESKMYAAPGAYNGVDGGRATSGTENGNRTAPDWNAVVRYSVSLPWDSSQNWTSGAPGSGREHHETNSDGTVNDWAYGGNGGGSAVGADGNDGRNAPTETSGGHGGHGADASSNPEYFPFLRYGGGGNGGHGGGEGGSGGTGHSEASYSGGAVSTSDGASGSGGAGSNGQNGANGCILIYYKSPDT